MIAKRTPLENTKQQEQPILVEDPTENILLLLLAAIHDVFTVRFNTNNRFAKTLVPRVSFNRLCQPVKSTLINQ